MKHFSLPLKKYSVGLIVLHCDRDAVHFKSSQHEVIFTPGLIILMRRKSTSSSSEMFLNLKTTCVEAVAACVIQTEVSLYLLKLLY